MSGSIIEANIDTLVGPTHSYGGLAFGNVASMRNRARLSSPQKAALQGLEKMKLLHELGAIQLVLPPQPRPHFATLKRLGFSGSDQAIIEKAYKLAPEFLIRSSSSASMWAANSATITPSSDSSDGKVHITPANLAAQLHRSIEVAFTERVFQALFANRRLFTVHAPIPSCPELFDEGAANHTRFCQARQNPGLHLFVWGRSASSQKKISTVYPARQSKEAQEAIIRSHELSPETVLFAQQHPDAIDAGVFHNDVIATGHETLFLLHEKAYVNTNAVINHLQEKAEKILKKPLCIVLIKEEVISLSDAVRSYLFNSQIVTAKGKRILIAPHEVETIQSVKQVVDALVQDPSIPLDAALFIPINQSMKNGGGPACLRLRLPMTEKELAHIHPGVIFSHGLYNELKACIEKYYPDRYSLADLLDPEFRRHIKAGELKIAKILQLPSIYAEL